MIFDTHAHYDDEAFDGDREELLSGLAAGGIGTVVNVGADMESTKTTIELTKRYPFIYGAVGVHPSSTAELDEEKFAELRVLAQSGKIVAIGEIGLDYLRPDREAQLRIFEGQLRLAEAAGKPVVLHCVKAFEETMRLLKQFRLRAVIFHGFIGSPEQAARAVAAGYYLSFGPRSLRSPRTVRALGSIPTQRLFLETDDAPATIESVYATAARLLGMPLDRLKETIYNNYLHIFS